MNILKPKVYEDQFDPTGYWMAEKFDGVRAEATVFGYNPGKGRNLGRCGSLQVKAMPFDSSRGILSFNVGTGLQDADRENPPAIGSVITYSYKGLTNAGLPRHPAYKIKRDYE
jgi:DNA ligase-1